MVAPNSSKPEIFSENRVGQKEDCPQGIFPSTIYIYVNVLNLLLTNINANMLLYKQSLHLPRHKINIY